MYGEATIQGKQLSTRHSCAPLRGIHDSRMKLQMFTATHIYAQHMQDADLLSMDAPL